MTDFPTYYVSPPVAFDTTLGADHSYAFIALTAQSYLYDFAVGGYTGRDAWNYLKGALPSQTTFSTQSPKWAILPFTN